MKHIILFSALLMLFTLPAPSCVWAGQSEARDIARQNNCAPKKIDIAQNSLGTVGKKVYQVSCTMPKTSNDTKDAPDALLIACDGSLCELIRPVSSAKK